jgi:hypothetical protein
VADVDPALGQQILDVAQRQWVSHVHHHETDDLWRAVEISERITDTPRLTQPGQPRICPDTAHRSAARPIAGRIASESDRAETGLEDRRQYLRHGRRGTKGHYTSEGSRAGIVESPPFPHEAEKLTEKLSTGTWTHDYPIFAAKAKELGLPVSSDMPNEVRTAIANIRATMHDRLFRETKGVIPRS